MLRRGIKTKQRTLRKTKTSRKLTTHFEEIECVSLSRRDQEKEILGYMDGMRMRGEKKREDGGQW